MVFFGIRAISKVRDISAARSDVTRYTGLLLHARLNRCNLSIKIVVVVCTLRDHQVQCFHNFGYSWLTDFGMSHMIGLDVL